jgi:hypothetical protein
MSTILDEIDQQRQFKRAEEVQTAPEVTCRITLAEDWPRTVPLKWCGGWRQRETILLLHPGKTLEQPIGRTRAWFGPFDLHLDYLEMPDGPKREKLRDFISLEITRFVMRYDWPRGNGRGLNPNMEKSGHNRAPDVSIQKVDLEGHHPDPIRIYEIYKLGEFDPEKDNFGTRKSAAEIEAEFKAQLDMEREKHDREVREMRLALAELKGEFSGAVAGAVASERRHDKVAAKA